MAEKIIYDNESNKVTMNQKTAKEVAIFIKGYTYAIERAGYDTRSQRVLIGIDLQKEFKCSCIPEDPEKFLVALESKIKELLTWETA